MRGGYLGLGSNVGDSASHLRAAIESRPAGALAKRVVPDYPGHTPPILPPEWLTPLSAPAAA